jgi:hypothetical protein
MAPFSPWGGILGQTLARGGFEVERYASSHMNNGGYQRCGVAKSQQMTCSEVHAQGGGVIWFHGGIIGRIGEVYADLNLEDGSAVQ